MITNSQSGTNIEEVASGIYRINTPIPIPGAGTFNFNQYLVVDESPLLFHTGQHSLFPLVQQAIESVMPVSRLRYIAFSHFEADECGALNDFLAVAPRAAGDAAEVGADVGLRHRGGWPRSFRADALLVARSEFSVAHSFVGVPGFGVDPERVRLRDVESNIVRCPDAKAAWASSESTRIDRRCPAAR